MPLPLIPIAIGAEALSNIWGAISGNKTNAANLKAQRDWQDKISGMANGFFTSGPNGAENQLLTFLNAMGSTPKATDNQAYNTGQDALSQMLRSNPVDPTSLFASWEPQEQRALQQNLAGAFSGASGLGQRFGSAQMKQEGVVRQQSAEDAQSRREQTSLQLAQSNATQHQQIAQALAQLGLSGEGANLAQQNSLLGGLSTLGGLEGQRSGQNISILQLLAGMGTGQQQPNQIPGAVGDVGQLLALMPFLQQLTAKTAGSSGLGGGTL